MRDCEVGERVLFHFGTAGCSTVSIGAMRLDRTNARAPSFRPTRRDLESAPTLSIVDDSTDGVVRCSVSRPMASSFHLASIALGLVAIRWLLAAAFALQNSGSRTVTIGVARMSIPSSPKPSRARGASVGQRRVLLVEHEEGCRAFAESALCGAGYHVDLACDGFEAIARLVDYRYDLVVCDVELPQLCGIDVVHELRNIERREGTSRCRTPVLAFTSDGRAETYARALDADIDLLLEKPLRSHELLESARDVADDRTVALIIDADAERTRSIEKWCADLPKVRALFAPSAADACLRLRRERIDLVAVHVSTEGLNGHSAARLLRVVAPATLPIVALLEGADEAARMRCLAGGYVDCVGEPLGKHTITSLFLSHRGGPSRPAPSRRLVSRPWSGAVIVAENDDDDVRALLPQFLGNLSRDIETLRADLAHGLLESSVRVGHNCKGTGTSYGLPGVSSIGARLEEAGYRGDLSGALACLGVLAFEVEQARARFG